MEDSLDELSTSFASINTQFTELSELKKSLDNFNTNMMNFLSALQMQAQTMEFEEPKRPKERNQAVNEPSTTNLTKRTTKIVSNEKITMDQVLKKMLNNLENKFNEPFHRNNIESIAKFLYKQKEGAYSNEIISAASIPKVKCMVYLNALVKSNDLLKRNHKGFIFSLNIEKFK